MASLRNKKDFETALHLSRNAGSRHIKHLSPWNRTFRPADISVQEQLIAFVYSNDYRQAKCHASWC